MLTKERRGIVLITVLFLTILISMFIGAAILVGPRTLGLASSQAASLTAKAAAESGMQYALMKIRANPEWKGADNGTTIDTPNLTVVENNGYVWGHLKAPDGSASMFRMRFNYEDGADGGDGMNDGGNLIPLSYISVNNLPGNNDKVVPRADDQGQVSGSSEALYTVPAHGICLLVEGLSGRGVRTFDPADPNPDGMVQSEMLEAVYIVSNLNDVAIDAVAMANNDTDVTLKDGGKMEVQAKGGVTPRIRSRGKVEVLQENGADGTYESDKGVVRAAEDGSGDVDFTASYDDKKVTTESENDSNPFYRLAWDDVKKADPTGPSLKAGTYVWWDDGTLHYYDMDYDNYVTHIKGNPADGGETVFSGSTYSGTGGLPSTLKVENKKLTITGDLYIEPTTVASDFTVIPREGAAVEPAGDQVAAQSMTASLALAEHLGKAGNEQLLQDFLVSQSGDFSPIPGGVGRTRGWNTAPGVGGLADIYWNSDGSGFAWDNNYGNASEALADAFQQAKVPVSVVETLVSQFGLIGAEGDLALNTGDSLTAEDLEIAFEPPDGGSATLSVDGNVRIGAKVKGEGASLTTQGTLVLTGAGADLAANPNAEEGVNMYAKGDITLSTLREKGEDDYEFKDIKLKGMVYTWGNVDIKLGTSDGDKTKWGKLSLEGTIIAYGGEPDPNSTTLPAGGSGNLNITAKEAKLVFDASYLLSVMQTLPTNLEFERTTWTTY